MAYLCKRSNKKYRHSGTLVEGHFNTKHINEYGHLLHLCRYIHANPVKDEMVLSLDDWPHSNYLEWIGKRNGALVDRAFIQEQFSGGEEYRKFVMDYLK